jgi:hypothetical protein
MKKIFLILSFLISLNSFSQIGRIGVAGATGATGVVGTTGITGITGSVGATGTITSSNLATVIGYSQYIATINQSATSAPVATNATNWFAATMTWARTSAGVYTITASAPTFTANKTSVIFSTPTLPLVTYKYVVTSSTVITITTNLESVIATVLTATPTDVLLSNSLFQIQVMN